MCCKSCVWNERERCGKDFCVLPGCVNSQKLVGELIKERNEVGSYSHKYWSCPFYGADKRESISCKGGCIKFENHRELAAYADRYCANASAWKKCTVAKMLCEREENRDG